MTSSNVHISDGPLNELSFAEATPEALEQWLANLPLVNITASAAQLSAGCQELTRLNTDAATRYQLVDTVRPLVHYISSRLSRTAGKHIIRPHQLAEVMANAFARSFGEAQAAGSDSKEQRNLLARCAHALLAERGRVLLYSLQHYQPLPDAFWAELHHAYLIAEGMEMVDFAQPEGDPDGAKLSIQDVYLRTLLLHCCRPGQLSSDDLAVAFAALEHWVGMVELSEDLTDALFAVDLQSEYGPTLAATQDAQSPTVRALRTEVLTWELDAYLNEIACEIVVPDAVSTRLLSVLARSWSTVTPRNFRRNPSAQRIRLCVGMRAIHYFLAGGVEFSEQISNSDAVLRREVNPFLDVDYEPVANGEEDQWDAPQDLKGRLEHSNLGAGEDAGGRGERKYHHYELLALDTSPEGYRVQWGDEVPVSAKVGEIVALREESDTRWCVAAIRWIAGDDHGTIHMGLELLAPRAIPVAVRPIQTRGGQTSYSRGLMLPGLDAIAQPPSLITPTVPFTPRQKVSVQRQGILATGLIMDRLQNTQNFNQFTFRVLDGYLESSPDRRNIDALSALTREDTTQDT